MECQCASNKEQLDRIEAQLADMLAAVNSGVAQIAPLMNNPMLKGLTGMFGK